TPVGASPRRRAGSSACRSPPAPRRRACARRPPRSRRRASSLPPARPVRRPGRRGRPSDPLGRPPTSSRLLGARGRPRRTAALGHAALEALDPSARVDQLLLARVERVAGGADLDVNLGLGRAGHELVAARTADVSVYVL